MGKGLVLLILGVIMIFVGYWKTRPSYYASKVEEEVAKWKETIDQWETLSQGFVNIDVSKDIQDEDPDALQRMIQQLNAVSSNLEDLKTAATNVEFCKAVQAEEPRYHCKRVNDLADASKVKISNALKIINEALDKALGENEKRANVEKSKSSSSSEEEKNGSEDKSSSDRK